MRTESQYWQPQVTDVIGSHGAGVAPNLIQQKLEGVFSVSRVVYLEKHHIIKTILWVVARGEMMTQASRFVVGAGAGGCLGGVDSTQARIRK